MIKHMKYYSFLLALSMLTGLTYGQEDENGGFDGDFYVGLNGGIPVGNNADITSFALSIDLGYTVEVSESIELGLSSGYTNWLGKDDFSNFSFAPLAATGQIELTDDLELGTDIGYAFNLSGGGGGDFYYKPFVALEFADDLEAEASFANVSGDGATFSALQLGIRYEF